MQKKVILECVMFQSAHFSIWTLFSTRQYRLFTFSQTEESLFYLAKSKPSVQMPGATFPYGHLSIWPLFHLATFQFCHFSIWPLFYLATFQFGHFPIGPLLSTRKVTSHFLLNWGVTFLSGQEHVTSSTMPGGRPQAGSSQDCTPN